MSTIEGSDNLAWSDEQTRFYLQLRLDEKLKGNIRKDKVNEAGRQSIIDKFYEVYGKRHPWKKFGIKFTACKKQYETLRKLTHNRTGLGYYANGSIHMSEDWWNDRCKEWPGARKIKDKPVPNTDLMQMMESYEQHGDENDVHVPYVPSGDRIMEDMRDSITTEMAEGTRLPY